MIGRVQFVALLEAPVHHVEDPAVLDRDPAVPGGLLLIDAEDDLDPVARGVGRWIGGGLSEEPDTPHDNRREAAADEAHAQTPMQESWPDRFEPEAPAR